MRLKISTSKNSASFYVIESIYNPKTKKNTSRVVEKLGTEKELLQKLNGQDPYLWAKNYVNQINAAIAQQKKSHETERHIQLNLDSHALIKSHSQQLYNGGYLFLQSLYYTLELDKLAKTIQLKYKISFDFNAIFSRLIYARLLDPSSKKSTFEFSKSFIENSDFELHHIYRALEIITKEEDTIQQWLFKKSKVAFGRNSSVLYYDCTNFFFEIEQEDSDNGLRQYGVSKEHRPNPIVQMGLFIDGNGIPLAFSLTPGNTNEQSTLKPLERKIIKEFEHAKVIVCTDAGLASQQNKFYNSIGGRAFVTTQSLKKLKKEMKDWALEPTGWRKLGDKEQRIYTINSTEHYTSDSPHYQEIYYKEMLWQTETLSQRLIITYSPKYKVYQQTIRERQVNRAQKKLSQPNTIQRKKPHSPERFIQEMSLTPDGEIADKKTYQLNEAGIEQEARYDGFYAVTSNLEDSVETIIRINQGRWEIEESFRLMKTELKARPVYLSRQERIKAHFTTCFAALTLFRHLEQLTQHQFTAHDLLTTLRGMNFLHHVGVGYIPTYTRTELTDTLHECFGFRTDYEINTQKKMKENFKISKSRKYYAKI